MVKVSLEGALAFMGPEGPDYAAAERVIRDGQDLVRRAANYREDKISETPFTELPGATSLPTVETGRRFYLEGSI